MTAVFNFDNVEDNTTYYTHYIRWIIEPKSKQKTTCYYNKNWKTKWKNLMSALKKKQRKELPRRNFDSCQKSLQLEYLFIISEIFLEFIYKLHILNVNETQPPPEIPIVYWLKTKVKTKRIPSKQRNSNLASKNPWEKNPNKLCMIVILREKKTLDFFFDSVHNDPKNYFTFRTRLKNKITLPTIY